MQRPEKYLKSDIYKLYITQHHCNSSVKCPIGRYEKDGVCTDCAANTYSKAIGSTKCTDCPGSLKTITTGSDSESDCTGVI